MHGKRKPSQTLDLQLFDGQVGHAATPWMNAGPAILPRPALVEWREARRKRGRCRSARPPCPFADPTCILAGQYNIRRSCRRRQRADDTPKSHTGTRRPIRKYRKSVKWGKSDAVRVYI